MYSEQNINVLEFPDILRTLKDLCWMIQKVYIVQHFFLQALGSWKPQGSQQVEHEGSSLP